MPADRIAIVYNGVPRPSSLARAHTRDTACRLVFLGRLSGSKGIPALLHALATPALQQSAWRATLAGDGEIDVYRQQAAELGLAERVDFPGWVSKDQVRRLLAEADIFVLPSHAEGLPVALAEALAHKVATVTTRVGAIPDLLVGEESTLFVDPGDADELAAALNRLILDGDLRDRIAKNGYDVFKRYLEVGRAASSIKQLYTAICPSSAREHSTKG